MISACFVDDALRGPLRGYARELGAAIRLSAEYGDFAELSRLDASGWRELARLMAADKEVVLVRHEEVRPRCADLRLAGIVHDQILVADRPVEPADGEVELLGDADFDEMVALRGPLEHGRFPARRHAMGRFVGIRRDGALVAMAGENLRPPGHGEVAGVAVRPDLRGTGLADIVVRDVCAAIQARGDVPFAQVTPFNTGSQRLFARLGFSVGHDLVMSRIVKTTSLVAGRA